MRQSKLCNLMFAVCIMFLMFTQIASSQTKPDSSLNKINPITKNFKGLIKWGQGYDIVPDSEVKHSGKYSMRIEPFVNAKEKMFGCGVFRIPVNFSGQEIELHGYLKLKNVTKGSAGLFMRIDGPAGMDNMDNMLNREIKGTSDWKMYSIKLPLNDDDKFIYYGAILSGTGKLWADDFQILIDGKDISEAKAKKESNYKALKDTTFNSGSKISLTKVTSKQCNDLTVLGELWGFLKYYHPAVAKGNINWDYELFRIMPKILNSKSKKERNKILLDWVNSLGDISEAQNLNNTDSSKIKMEPDLNWIKNDKELGKKLTEVLGKIKLAKRSSHNFYLGFVRGVGNPIFEHENAYSNMIYPDAGYRLLSLFRYWNIIQYFFPYKNLIKDNWQEVLHNFIPEFLSCRNALEYRLTIIKLIGKIHDTHAQIYGNAIMNEYFGKNIAPCKISFIKNKAVITKVYLKIDSAIQLKSGDVITKINNKNIDEIVKKRLPVYPASNYPTQLRNIAVNLLRTNDASIKVTYNRQGKLRTTEIKCYNLEKVYSFVYNTQKKSWKIIDGNIGYIYPGTIKNPELPEIMQHFKKCKGLIIDMRCYPSDFIVFTLGKYLMPAPTPFVKFSYTNYKMPGRFFFTKDLKVGTDNPNYFKGKVVIIVNSITQSSAEYHAMAFRAAPQAIIIGSTTAGADGNVSQFYLPGGIKTMISGIGVYYPDGTETEGVGIVPDIKITPTITGIREGKDELLEKAVSLINK